MATTTLEVDGMTCGACTSAVEGAFKNVSGVHDVSVSLILGRAVVQHDPQILSAEKVAEMIEDRGFDARVLSTDMQERKPGNTEPEPYIDSDSTSPKSITTLSVQGMTCGACVAAIEGGFTDVSGVKSITVSLLSERAVVEHDRNLITPEKIAEIIEDRGFDASVVETTDADNLAHGLGGKMTGTKQQTRMNTTVSIEGMTCGACTSSVENAVKDQPGLIRFDISLLAERAIVVHDSLTLPAARIVELIENAGFDAKVVSSEPDVSIQSSDSSSASFSIYGLLDATSALELEGTLRQVPGITGANVKLATARAFVTYNPHKIGIRAIVESIEKQGYNAIFASSDDNNAQLESLAKTKEIHEWRRAFWMSFSFAVPVMLISMLIPMYVPVIDFGKFELIPGLFLGDVLCLFLTIPVQFGIGRRFYIASFKSLKHRTPTMDVLIMLSTTAAFVFSVIAMMVSVFFPPHTRPSIVFETSTMLITFITLGRWLENRAKGQTSRALSRLMSLTPSMAMIYDDPIAAEKAAEDRGESLATQKEPQDTQTAGTPGTKLIPTELIQVGDVVCLRPGDKVPADGTVIRGETYVDESMITGEANPIRKIKGQSVIAGTVNGAGWVDFRVTRAGRDTQLSQIVKLVQDAQTNRAPIQRMADVVAGYFVPAIIALGLVTFFGWMILSHVLPNPPQIFVAPNSGGRIMVCLKLCISVIVFACPCALGLSTPTAVMVGTGVGAEHGILVKGGAALEATTKVKHVVFDKTGTLTMGKTTVADTKIDSTWSSNEWRRRLWWSIVCLAEVTSEHPIGKTIVSTAKAQLGLANEDSVDGAVVDFEATVGKGVSALVEPASSFERTQYKVAIGNVVFLKSHGVQVPASLGSDFPSGAPATTTSSPSPTKSEILDAATSVHVAIDGQYAGTIWLLDVIKPTAKAAVASLHRMGITTSLVTGDTYSTALAVANAVGIPEDSIHASVSPLEKRDIIAQIQTPASPVAMVGDGINDSPALATASVGIALASGTDVAIEAADVVLMRPDDLLSVPASLCLARAIFSRIKLNLLWACLYNAIGLPFAMGIFLPFGGLSLHPMAAGAAMAASSVSVVLSSLLLKLWKQPRWLDVQKLERELELGKISPPGPDRVRRRRRWWSPRSSSSTGMISRLGTEIISRIPGLRKKGTEDEGYVLLQTVEPAV
ncbi:hypothetical protein VTO42DRAFT_5050 [Malbranchea cinnamomea]